MIRPATRSDVVALAVLHRASIMALCSYSYNAEQLNEWTSLLRPELYEALIDSRAVFVFAEGSELLGLGVCDPSLGLINAAYVHPSATRRGIGSALMSSMEQALSRAGSVTAKLNATLNATGFYENLGYVRDGSGINRLPSGAELACELMSKPLNQNT